MLEHLVAVVDRTPDDSFHIKVLRGVGPARGFVKTVESRAGEQETAPCRFVCTVVSAAGNAVESWFPAAGRCPPVELRAYVDVPHRVHVGRADDADWVPGELEWWGLRS